MTARLLRCRISLAAAILAFIVGTAPAALAQDNAAGNSNLVHFLERVADLGPASGATWAIGKLPDGFSSDIPLPVGAKLLGSVQRVSDFFSSTGLYYEADTDLTPIVDAYVGSLRAAGWTESHEMAFLEGGFSGENLRTFCAAGRPSIMVDASSAAGSRNLTVSVMLFATIAPCAAAVGASRSASPLPRLVAPGGTQMAALGPPTGGSHATLTTSSPLRALVDAFAAQLSAAQWTLVDKAIGEHTAVASFTTTDSTGTPWEAALTLYASPNKPNTVYAIINPANRNPALAQAPTGRGASLSASPLPRLVAPGGTQMAALGPPAPVGSRATLTTSAPLRTLLDAFAAQLSAAQWKLADKTIGNHTAVASFTTTDSTGAPWEAVLTLYASPDKPNTVYVILNPANRNPAFAAREP